MHVNNGFEKICLYKLENSIESQQIIPSSSYFDGSRKQPRNLKLFHFYRLSNFIHVKKEGQKFLGGGGDF